MEGTNININTRDCGVRNYISTPTIMVNSDRIDTPKTLNTQENNKSGCPELNPLDFTKSIPKLPAEVLAEIFNYLTHTEKLISRLVCTHWNHQISSVLAKTSYFTLTNVDNHQVFVDSQVPWTKIKMFDSHRFALGPSTRGRITGIVLKVLDTASDMKNGMRILSRFPQLTDLNLNIHHLHDYCDMDSSDEDETSSGQEFKVLKNQVQECTKNLQDLTIKFPYGEFDGFQTFLQGFFGQVSGLVKLTLGEKRTPIARKTARRTEPPLYVPMPQVSRMISKSSRSLKYLEFDFVSKCRDKSIAKLVSKMCKLEHLKLESLLIYLNATEGMDETEFKIHEGFFKKQIAKGSMKSLNISSCPNDSLCQKFTRFRPINIKFVGDVCSEHVTNTDEFYSAFSKCQTMGIHSRDSSMFSQPWPSIRQFHYAVTDDEHEASEGRNEFYKHLGNSLINLQEFKVVRDWGNKFHSSPLFDHDLQLVIKNFQQLRVLEIQSGRKITDSNVSGIQESYLDELGRRSGDSDKELWTKEIIPEDKRNGVPLSSLKCLQKLVLLGTWVSDVGIYYRLQFGPTLRHLKFETTEEISDWGLQGLGAGNPRLESLDCSVRRGGTFLLNGRKKLREQLPMLEATGKLKIEKRQY